ncbi:carboxylate-amine ligase [Marmoricola sp. RAF53]|uniref:carboxylate-amine ligase n=1 Tax=Marmoricola sp. RAF53 TaxID=3233059 RepID=UPI003F99717C
MSPSSIELPIPEPVDDLLRQQEQAVPSHAAFAVGGDFTVGAEEELLLVDDRNRLLATPRDGLVAALAGRSGSTVTPELFGAEIEFATPVARSGEEVGSCLRDLRSALRAAGGRAMAVGVHPAGELGDVAVTRSARYDAIGSSLAGLLRTPTAALQVHVGMPDAESAFVAMRGLRHQLALFRALACGSPYWHGRDSGLASARWAVVGSYPRSGVPPVFRCWEEYLVLADALAAAAEVPDDSWIWWDLRPRPRLGTLEVRVLDAQPSLAVVAGMVSLVQGLARAAVERPRQVDVPSAVLAENDFRVARDGLDARIVDLHGTMRPVRELAVQAISDARSVLAADGLDGPLSALERLLYAEPEYDRQRRFHREHGMAGLLRDLTARTSTAF